MFEYLMPALVMQTFPYTLLDQTHKGSVRRQIAYGLERGVPWGVSESAYAVRDRAQTYQYRGFGVPAPLVGASVIVNTTVGTDRALALPAGNILA